MSVLLDAVVEGLKRLPKTRLEKLPRMADFALWVTACETALWDAGTFLAAYADNREEAVDNVIDADPVASVIRSLMTTRTVWTGTASDLLGVLGVVAGKTVRKARSWPGTARALSGRLRRSAPSLRKVGIEISFAKEGRNRTRTITVAIAVRRNSAETAGADDADGRDAKSRKDSRAGRDAAWSARI